jgi:hypothetical protein
VNILSYSSLRRYGPPFGRRWESVLPVIAGRPINSLNESMIHGESIKMKTLKVGSKHRRTRTLREWNRILYCFSANNSDIWPNEPIERSHASLSTIRAYVSSSLPSGQSRQLFLSSLAIEQVRRQHNTVPRSQQINRNMLVLFHIRNFTFPGRM